MKCPECHTDNSADTLYCGKCGARLIPDESPATRTLTLDISRDKLANGSTFAGRYQVIAELGHGGMGKVYEVFDLEIRAVVALKLMRPEIAKDPSTIERFRNELKLARDIVHKNICRMYDLGREGETYYITMEYVQGEDLKDMIKMSGKLDVGTAVHIAREICDGLTEAHGLGILHRDLKPANIMVDREGHVRIMDFGIARSIKAEGITKTGVTTGTPEFMSPEQIEGKDIDQRSDLYSLGVILYAMVTGRLPFEGKTAFAVANKQVSERPKDPRELNGHLPESLCNLILKCLEKDRINRYQSAAEVRSKLENIGKGMPSTKRVISAQRPIISAASTIWLSLKKHAVALLIVGFLVIFGVTVWRLILSKKVTPLLSGKPSIAILYFKNSTGDKSFDVWRDGLTRMLISGLSQSRLIRVVADDQIYGILSKLNALEKDNFSTEDLREIASRGKATHLLRGMITKAGNSFRIQATLQETRNLEEIAGNYSSDGSGEGSFFGMIDELIRNIKMGLNLSGSQIVGEKDRRVEELTTTSAEAYKLCNEGYRFNYRGEIRKSAEALEQAVAIDPQFALAHCLLGLVYGQLGYSLKSNESMRRAFELSDRLPEKERLFVQSFYFSSFEKSYDKAIKVFNERLRLYPDDLNAARNFGGLLSKLEQWDKALELYETNIKNKVEAYFPYADAATAYRAKGLYSKARDVLEDYLARIGNVAAIHRALSETYLCQGSYDLAIEEADKALSMSPGDYENFSLKGDIQLLRGNFLEAEKEYQHLFASGEKSAQLSGMAYLLRWYLCQGQYKKAEAQANQGIRLSQELDDEGSEYDFHLGLGYCQIRSENPGDATNEFDKALKIGFEEENTTAQVIALHPKGLAILEMKSFPEALRISDELKKTVQSWLNPKLMRSYYHLMGTISLRKGNFAEAIGHYRKAISLLDFECKSNGYCHAIYYEPLAFACYELGDLEEAREDYEKITLLTTGRLYYGDIYAKSFYMLGKIAELKGDKNKAREHYQKFLELWKDADPGQSEVEDARKRLLRLKGI